MKNQKTPMPKSAKSAKCPFDFYTLANQLHDPRIITGMEVTKAQMKKELAALNRFDSDVRKKPIRELMASGSIEKNHCQKSGMSIITTGWPERQSAYRYTMETETFRYVFQTSQPVNLADVQIIACGFLRLADKVLERGSGYEIDHDETGELSAAEKAAHRTERLLEIVESEQQPKRAAGTNPRTEKNPKGAGRKPNSDAKTGDKIFYNWNQARKADGKLTIKEFWKERYSETMGYDPFSTMIDSARKRRNRKLK